MTYRYENNVEHELSEWSPIEMLKGINIELKDIPGNDRWRIDYIFREDGRIRDTIPKSDCLGMGYALKDGVIILDVKDSHEERLKNALNGVIFFNLENRGYVFGDYFDRERESEIDGLVEKIISEPSSHIVQTVKYMIEEAELKYRE